MPGRFGGRRRNNLATVINSNKNIRNIFSAVPTGSNTIIAIAVAVDSAQNTVTTEVTRGCKIFKVWFELWVSASAESAVGVTTGVDAYIMKNPGANLTPANPGSVGSSNEKKQVFKIWKGLVGARTQGFPAYQWKGWIKIPKIYQRMGADDVLQFVIRPTGVNLIACTNFVYKWYT